MLNTQPGLGLEDYLKYKSELDKERSDIKGEYDRSKNRVNRIQQDLLAKYEKLFQLVEEEEEIEKRQDEDGWAPGRQLGILISKGDQEVEKEQRRQLHANLLLAVEKLQKEYDEENILLTKRSQNLSEILLSQGTVTATAEKAEAKDISLRRSKMREEAHNCILEALAGDYAQEDEVESHSMQFGAPKTMREKKDQNDAAWDAIQGVRKEFELLAKQEAETDQHVDRLRVKLDSISLLEESQVEMVDFQNRLRQTNLDKIKGIEGKVQRNNDDIVMMTKRIQGSLQSKLDDLVPTNMKAAITCTVCLIISVCIFLVVFFAAKVYSNGFSL